MTMSLAVFTSQLGTASETFIRRHVEDLMPGRTVVVAQNSTPAFSEAFGRRRARSCPRLLDVMVVSAAGPACGCVRGISAQRGPWHASCAGTECSVVLGEYLGEFMDSFPCFIGCGFPMWWGKVTAST